MKKHLPLSLLATLIMFSGCWIEKAEPPRVDLAVDPQEINATSAGGIYTIEVTSRYKNWKATVENDYWWCTPTPDGDPDGKLLTITLTENESSITRNTTVIITSVTATSDTLSVEIKVTQAGISDNGEEPPPHGLFVDITYLPVSIYGAQYFIFVKSSHPWTAEVTEGGGWCFLHDAMGEGGHIITGTGDGVLTLDTRDNETQSERIATIRVYSEELNQEVTITVYQEPNTYLAVLQTSGIKEVPAEGGSYFIDIMSNTDWTVEVISEDSEWCTLSNTFGSKDGTITVTVGENPETSGRLAIVRVSAGPRYEEVAISQRGIPYLVVTPTDIAVSYSQSTPRFSISSNNEWKARVSYSNACIAVGDTSWCTISSASGGADREIIIYVWRNIYDKDRIAFVTVTSAGLSEVVTITQESSTNDPYYLKMITVRGGTFTMGATPEQGAGFSDEEPTHEVTLSSFQIMEHEVSEGQWRFVMMEGGVGDMRPSSLNRGDNFPVENVSWNDVQLFIKTLDSLTGRNYRLPTEAEWEYAARGGPLRRDFKYSGSNELSEVAWYGENSYDRDLPDWRQAKHAIRSKYPNELGIYDMTGNVWEWCSDIYAAYSDSTQINPTGPEPNEDNPVEFHVFRGGSWLNMESDCHISRRDKGLSINYRYGALGFRLVLPLPDEPEP